MTEETKIEAISGTEAEALVLKGTKRGRKKKKVESDEVKTLALKPAEEPKPVYETYEDFPIEDLLTYAGIDCIVTSDLASSLMPHLTEEPAYKYVEPNPSGSGLIQRIGRARPLDEVYAEYTAEAHEFIIDLELNGLKYNVPRNREIKAQMEKEISELNAAVFSAIGKEINLDSGAKIGEYLYEEKGFKAVSFTKTGEPSTDGDALKALLKENPTETWLGTLAKRNDISSLYRTFVATYVEDFVKRDGRIHPSYNMFGTGSFRISGEEPNLTQLPRPKHGYNLRELFRVDDGEVFMAFDFSSAEVKILGALCKDPQLLKAIAEGKDFHSFSACAINGLDYDEFVAVIDDDEHPNYKKYKQMRQAAKATTFGILKTLRPLREIVIE